MRSKTTVTILAIAILTACAAVAWISQQGSNRPADPLVPAEREDAPAREEIAGEPTAAQRRIAQAIANGHAYQKHVVGEKLFPEVKNKADFAELIGRLLAQPTHHRRLENGREAYFDQVTNTIVIYNPHARDKGTCFRPRSGLRYYERLK